MLKTSLIKTLALWAVATALAGQAAVAQTVICVDADAPGANETGNY